MAEESEEEDWNQPVDDVTSSRTFIKDSEEDWTRPLQGLEESGSRNKDDKKSINKHGKQEISLSGVETTCSSLHPRTVLHIDVDCFYAQVEMLRNPDLRDKPLGIQQKFIVVTCNYKAREYGVTKLMTIKNAKEKCPQLVLVSGEDLTNYREMSYRISEYLQRYTPYVERLGFDENFLDISTLVEQRISSDSFSDEVTGHVYLSTNSSHYTDNSSVCGCGCSRRITVGTQVAADIRKALYKELGITCCGGVSYNKLLAKLVGEVHKPNQQTCLFPEQVQNFMTGLDKVRKIPGIGSSTVKKLQSLGIHSVTDLQNYPQSDLKLELGESQAVHIHRLSHGIDEEIVHTYGKPQTISDEDSYNYRKVCTVDDARGKIRGLLSNLLKRLEEDGRLAQTIRLSVCRIVEGKFGRRESKQCSLPAYLMAKLSSKRGEMLDKLQEMLMSLLDKLINLSKPFQIALMNIAFCNFQEKTKNSISNFFSPKRRSLSSQNQEEQKDNQNFLVEQNLQTATAEHDQRVNIQLNNSVVQGLKRKSALDKETSDTKRQNSKTTSMVQNGSQKMVSGQCYPLSESSKSYHTLSPLKTANGNNPHTQVNRESRGNRSPLSDNIDLSVLAQLPPDIRAEILPQLTMEQRTSLSDHGVSDRESLDHKVVDHMEAEKSEISQTCASSDRHFSNSQDCETKMNNTYSSSFLSSDCSSCTVSLRPENIPPGSSHSRNQKEPLRKAYSGSEDKSTRDTPPLFCHSDTAVCSSGSVTTLSSSSSFHQDGLPSDIDREIFYSLPPDIQREILSEHKYSHNMSEQKSQMQIKHKNLVKKSSKGKPSDGNILNFLRKNTSK